MFDTLSSQDVYAYVLFGIILNFGFSLAFGLYLSKNIGLQEMMSSKGEKEQSILIQLAILIPYAKMIITLYRVTILQIYFLNRGFTHKEFWIYLTNEHKAT
ncbi:MAG: hypothetical protein GQ570_05865 [Helicobacteraceae bacterium]|nr:hypothetical protein [Helicobacteraceae bacterium]